MAKISKRLQRAVADELRSIDVNDEFIQTYFDLQNDQALILINGEEGLRNTQVRAVYADGMVLGVVCDSWEVLQVRK